MDVSNLVKHYPPVQIISLILFHLTPPIFTFSNVTTRNWSNPFVIWKTKVYSDCFPIFHIVSCPRNHKM